MRVEGQQRIWYFSITGTKLSETVKQNIMPLLIILKLVENIGKKIGEKKISMVGDYV